MMHTNKNSCHFSSCFYYSQTRFLRMILNSISSKILFLFVTVHNWRSKHIAEIRFHPSSHQIHRLQFPRIFHIYTALFQWRNPAIHIGSSSSSLCSFCFYYSIRSEPLIFENRNNLRIHTQIVYIVKTRKSICGFRSWPPVQNCGQAAAAEKYFAFQ